MIHRITRSHWLTPSIFLLLLHSRYLPADDLLATESREDQTHGALSADSPSADHDRSATDRRRRIGFVGILVVMGVVVIMIAVSFLPMFLVEERTKSSSSLRHYWNRLESVVSILMIGALMSDI